MLELIHNFLEKYAPEGIPFPSTRIYSLFTKSRLLQDFYREVANEVTGELHQGKILDIGTGPGYLPIEIAKLIPNAEVLGIDISSDMIRIARKNAEKAKASNVRFMVEDANKMSFEDSLFDLVVSTGSLHHWKKPLRVVNEVHRILKDGGGAWVYDLRRDAPDEVIVKKLREYGYRKLKSSILYNAIKVHSTITLHEVLDILQDEENRFKQYNIKENWHSYPVLKVELLKSRR